MPKGNAELLEFGIGEQTQGFQVDVAFGEDCGVTLQAKALEPGRQSVHVHAILRRFRTPWCAISAIEHTPVSDARGASINCPYSCPAFVNLTLNFLVTGAY